MKRFRKILSLALFVSLVLTLAGCGKVSKLEETIDEIGTVTLSDLSKIWYAEELYGELSDKEKQRVDNIDVLFAAREAYDRLDGLRNAAEEAIAAIGEVSYHSGEAIAHARQAYDTAVAAGLETNLTEALAELEKAENAYAAYAFVDEQLLSAREELDRGNPELALNILTGLLTGYPEVFDQASALTLEVLDVAARKAYQEGGAADAMAFLMEHGNLLDFAADQATADALKAPYLRELEPLQPEHGSIFHNTLDTGHGEFIVKAGSDEDALVKLESASDPECYILFYVRKGQTMTLNVADGSYIVKYTCGEAWLGDQHMFGPNAGFTQAEETFDFVTTSDDLYIYYTSISITLYTVIGGDLDVMDIPADAF